MKYIASRFKGLILCLVLLALFAFGFGMLMPNKITSNRVYFTPSDTLIAQLSDVSTYKYWFAPIAKDTNLAPLYSSNTKGVGAFVKYGDNTLTITKVDSSGVLFEVENKTGTKIESGFKIQNINSADTNNVSWYFVTGNSWLPWQRLRSVALEKVMKPEMRKSLEDLNNYLTKNYKQDGLAINEGFTDDKYLITKSINDPNNLKALFESAKNFRNELINTGYNENDLSKNFYCTYLNAQPFIAFGVSNTTKQREHIINLDAVKQIEYTNFKKDTAHKPLFKAMDNYAMQKGLVVWNNYRLIKYINWQFVTATQRADEKLIILCK